MDVCGFSNVCCFWGKGFFFPCFFQGNHHCWKNKGKKLQFQGELQLHIDCVILFFLSSSMLLPVVQTTETIDNNITTK